MREIRFPTHEVSFPSICACCGRPSTHTLKQTKEDLGRLALAVTVAATRSAAGRSAGFAGGLRRNVEIDVPVCLACKRHTVWEKGGGYFGLVLGGALSLGGFGLGAAMLWGACKELFAFDPFVHYPRATFVGFELVGLALAALPIWLRLRNNVGHGPQHLSGADPVEIVRFDAESLTLRVRRGDLLAGLLAANPGAVAPTPARAAAAR